MTLYQPPPTNGSSRKRSQKMLFAMVVALLVVSVTANFYLIVTRIPLGTMVGKPVKNRSMIDAGAMNDLALMAGEENMIVLTGDTLHAVHGTTNIRLVLGADRAVLCVNNLRPLDRSETYQVWYLSNKKMIAGEKFLTDGVEGNALVALTNFAKIKPDAIALSVEPLSNVKEGGMKPFAVTRIEGK